MPILTELTLYPIKSCAGIALQEAVVTDTGLASGSIRDREWMVVDAQGQFVTQRTHPRMALIVPGLRNGSLILNAPGLPSLTLPLNRANNTPTIEVRVWKDHLPADDSGDEAAAWMAQAIGAGCRLVRFHAHAKRVASPKWTRGIEASNLFSDSFPFLVIAQSSLNDLNARLRAHGREALPMNRFRPNVVIGDVPAYAEDSMPTLCIGEAKLQLIRPCQRCPIPSIDQSTGQIGDDPLDILKQYHTSGLPNGAATFGVHAILLRGAGTTLRVGQPITTTTAAC